jgi:RHS repeat-associated protein
MVSGHKVRFQQAKTEGSDGERGGSHADFQGGQSSSVPLSPKPTRPQAPDPGPPGIKFPISSEPACDIIFTGRRYDPETAIYFYRVRFYNPQLGRFIQRDSLGYEEGPNLAEYVRARCATRVDPTGLESLASCGPARTICNLACLIQHAGDADAVFECVDDCGAEEIECMIRNMPCSFSDLPSNSPECDNYDCDDEYAGANARCFCKCAGDSPWSQYVRGCLRCLYESGVAPRVAHHTCYRLASNHGHDMPWITLAYCYHQCS